MGFQAVYVHVRDTYVDHQVGICALCLAEAVWQPCLELIHTDVCTHAKSHVALCKSVPVLVHSLRALAVLQGCH